MSTSNPEHDELLEDIAATREQLGATVEELAHRLDVKAQVDEKVSETKEAVHAKVEDAKEKVVEAKDTVTAKVGDVTKTVAAKAVGTKDTMVHKVADAKDAVAAKVQSEKTPAAHAAPQAAEPPWTNAARGIPTIPVHAGSAQPAGIRDRAMQSLQSRDVQLGAAVAALASALAAILLRKS